MFLQRLIFMKIFFVFCLLFNPAFAQEDKQSTCMASDRPCLLKEIERSADTIENQSWKDKAYRELAKSYTYEGQEDDAIALLDKIENPDTKALTIRGIGFAAADREWEETRKKSLWVKLSDHAVKIDHAPSHGIALTYIAMAQAFAGDDAAATATAKSMENDALRHKAFGESAEIQAERGDFQAAMASISHIDSLPFRNKAHRIVSKIFVTRNEVDKAYEAARKIENPTMKAQALQLIVNKDNPEEAIK